MKLVGPNSLVRIVAKHPWSSLRDAAVLCGVMIFAVLLALQYDVFAFVEQLADPKRALTAAEGVLLAVLLAICIYTFIARRLREEWRDDDHEHQFRHELRELRALAMQDPLTGLPNRRALLAELDDLPSVPLLDRWMHAFFVLDLNGFKRINDIHGHAFGDNVLQVVVERFRSAARPSDLLARLGGDEFAVISYCVDRDAALEIGCRFIAALKNEILVEGFAHEIGVAVGAALFPSDGMTTQEILRHSDLAMYRAKLEARSSIAFFDPAVDAPVLTQNIRG